jgi:3,4-dihydroxy 2-butanone 4-phosphate synthase/GTP cyclohydrolase II
MKKSQLIKEAEARIPTDWGEFRMLAFKSNASNYAPHIVMVHPEMDPSDVVTMRIHSECLTGDLFHSQRCDCGEQLDQGMKTIAKEKGLLVYMRQEGRGIGIINKLKAYNKQDEGLNTIEANEALGLEVDGRRYDEVIRILESLGVTKVNLLTNNPLKLQAVRLSNIELVERRPIEIEPHSKNSGYLTTKKEEMGHLLTF